MQTADPTPKLSFKCPGCGATIRAPRQLIGTSRPCPGCGHKLAINVPMPSDSDIHLVGDDRKPAGR